MASDFDLSAVRFVKRIVAGSDDPLHATGQEESVRAIELLNRCLSGTPAGRIIGVEKASAVFNVGGENQAVFQWITYHVGFVRKPAWLTEDEAP